MKNYHLCKEDYAEVKRMVGMRKAAEFYGYPASQKGLCRCPFHNDNHPSMKIYPDDRGFFCFSCQTGGDVIKFVSGLYDLRNEEACMKLIEDFSLPIKTEFCTYREKREREKKIRRQQDIEQFRKAAYVILRMYWILLCEASRDPGDRHFAEALQELSIVEYKIECLQEDPEGYFDDKKAVRKIGEIRDRVIRWYERAETRPAVSG